MNKNLLLNQLQEAVELEDKFILEFNGFLGEHVSSNYHLTDSEKEFVDKRIKILFIDSKRHLGLFQSIIEEIKQNKDIIL